MSMSSRLSTNIPAYILYQGWTKVAKSKSKVQEASFLQALRHH